MTVFIGPVWRAVLYIAFHQSRCTRHQHRTQCSYNCENEVQNKELCFVVPSTAITFRGAERETGFMARGTQGQMLDNLFYLVTSANFPGS